MFSGACPEVHDSIFHIGGLNISDMFNCCLLWWSAHLNNTIEQGVTITVACRYVYYLFGAQCQTKVCHRTYIQHLWNIFILQIVFCSRYYISVSECFAQSHILFDKNAWAGCNSRSYNWNGNGMYIISAYLALIKQFSNMLYNRFCKHVTPLRDTYRSSRSSTQCTTWSCYSGTSFHTMS